MQRPQFIENGIYHVYNRGVDKRKIFMDNKDYFRFVHDLFEFNDKNPAISGFRHGFNNHKPAEVGLRQVGMQKKDREPRKLLTDILIFTLMPNHFHLLLRERERGNISKFMQKLGTGYTNYFNKKHERSGVLFQGKFKAVGLEENAHFLYLPHYIHTNPLKLMDSQSCRSRTSAGLEYLENYRWSSYLDYIGKKKLPFCDAKRVFA
ncbi:transposase [Patescibacteria group bacterium]